MKLSEFLIGLLESGSVTVPREMTRFEADDLDLAAEAIKDMDRLVRLEMPGEAPALHMPAALWAAAYLFNAVQLVLLRDLDEAVIDEYLLPYTGEVDSMAVYSVDLLFCHLGPLFKLSSGLAPDDPLVSRLRTNVALWPYSSVSWGRETLTNANLEPVYTHPSLRIAYMDRVIQYKNSARLSGDVEWQLFDEVRGTHVSLIWPDLEKPA